MTGKATPGTQRLVSEVACSLRTAGAQAVVAGVSAPVPTLEDLAAIADASSPDFSIGLRSLESFEKCAAIITPKPVAKPAEATGPVGIGDLGPIVHQLAASSRAEVSASLGDVLRSVIQECPRLPLETEQYLLDSTNSPTVILAIGSSDAAALIRQIPALLETWIAMEQSEGAT